MDGRLRWDGCQTSAPVADKEVERPGQRPSAVAWYEKRFGVLLLPPRNPPQSQRKRVIQPPVEDSFRRRRKSNRPVPPIRRSRCRSTAPFRLQARGLAQIRPLLSLIASWLKTPWHLFIRLPRERKAGDRMSEWSARSSGSASPCWAWRRISFCRYGGPWRQPYRLFT